MQAFLTALVFIMVVGPSATRAAEIVLEQTAVQKLVQKDLFNDKGRLMLVRGTCEAYLEFPVVSLANGRVVIAAHLTGRFGAAVAGNCLGVGLASNTKVSGKPVASGGGVQLTDIRIDEVQDATTRAVLVDSGLVTLLPKAVTLDVASAVRSMLSQGVDQVQATLDTFSFQDVRVIVDKLSMKFDFKLVGR